MLAAHSLRKHGRVNRILVVDDEKGICFAVTQYFAGQGYTVDCANTSEDALELLAAHHYSVAIIDVELRGSFNDADGLHLAEVVRRHAPSTAVIILTAVETSETQRRAREAGVHSFLQKPARLAHIAAVALGLMSDASVLAQ